MMLCQCMEAFWQNYHGSQEVALIQSFHTERKEVSYLQVFQWCHKLRVALNGDEERTTVGINLTPFSIEETVMMLVVAKERHWIYVPIDIELPLARQLSLLLSAGIRRLVTFPDSPLAKFFASGVVVDMELSPFRPVQVLVLPKNKETELGFTRQKLNIEGEDVAASLYVLFTSGTTGKPRGVLGTRTGAWTRLEWMWETYPFATNIMGERVLRATKLSFVDSVWEILGAFLQRVPLVHLQRARQFDTGYYVMKSVVLDDSARFLEVMRIERITRFSAVPSVIEVLLLQTIGTDLRSALAGLRYMLSSGETLLLHVVQHLTNTLPDVTILNLYGSTEMSGDVTCMELKAPLSSAQITEWQQHGVPVARLDGCGVVGDDTSLVLLSDDHEKKTVPEPSDGTPTIIWPRSTTSTEKSGRGMLYVSGSLVTLGYIICDQEDVFVTSETIQNKLDNTQQEVEQARRWFCTGDICLVNQGHLYFCGRKDNMIKILGQRVSLEAVERAVAAALEELSRGTRFDDNYQVIAFTTTKEVTKHTLFQQCIVVCIICNDTNNVSAARYHQRRTLNAWIAEHYGLSHVPHDIIVMPSKAFQRLAHGKVDRRALETFYKDRAGGNSALLPNPRISSKSESRTQKFIAQLLKDILDISLLDGLSGDVRAQTFTDLGGNSLLAILFMHELRQAFGALPLSSQDLLEKTIGEVLLVLDSQCENHSTELSPQSIQPRIRPAESTSAGDVKRRKIALHTHSSDTGGIKRDDLDQRGSLAYVSRYNQSSMAMDGIYLPTCFSSSVPSPELAGPTASSWQLRSAWRVNLEKCIDASPLVVQRRDSRGVVCSTWAIVGSHSAQLVCVDVQDAGREIWKVTLDDRIEACAALSVKRNTVYVGTYAGSLFALDLQSGETRWKFQAKGTIKTSAVVLDSHQLVVCGAYDNNLYGLDTVTGQQRWALNLGGSVFSTSFHCPWTKQLFAASTNGNVVALTPASVNFSSIKEQWRLHLPAPVFAGLNADFSSNMLVVGCADGQLYGVSMSSGDIQWQVSTGKPIFSSPCVYSPGSVMFGSHDGMLRKVDCYRGKLIWSTNLHGAIFASPSVVRILDEAPDRGTAEQKKSNDRLVCCVTTTAGWVYFCDESTGAIVYQTCEAIRKATKRENSDNISGDLGPLFGSPVLIDNWCLLGARTNLFYGFEMVSNNTVVNLVHSNGEATRGSIDEESREHVSRSSGH